MEGRQIIELYWQKRPEAISETAEKYGAYCLTIAGHILHNRQDAETACEARELGRCVRCFVRPPPEAGWMWAYGMAISPLYSAQRI